jgi:peptide chain release factor 2
MDEIKARAHEVLTKLDLDSKRKKIRELEVETLRPDFWADSQAAAKKMRALSALQKEVSEGELFELMIEQGSPEELDREVGKLEFALYLSGQFDHGDAILALHAGQGGTEAGKQKK